MVKTKTKLHWNNGKSFCVSYDKYICTRVSSLFLLDDKLKVLIMRIKKIKRNSEKKQIFKYQLTLLLSLFG